MHNQNFWLPLKCYSIKNGQAMRLETKLLVNNKASAILGFGLFISHAIVGWSKFYYLSLCSSINGFEISTKGFVHIFWVSMGLFYFYPFRIVRLISIPYPRPNRIGLATDNGVSNSCFILVQSGSYRCFRKIFWQKSCFSGWILRSFGVNFSRLPFCLLKKCHAFGLRNCYIE